MPNDDRERLREHLDTLAGLMADATDRGDVGRAWRLLRHLETAVDTAEACGIPPTPVLGRRFARAHGAALRHAETDPRTLLHQLLPTGAPRFAPTQRRTA